MGVYDRIEIIKDQDSKSPVFRQPYNYQIPLQFMPGIGNKMIGKLLDAFGTEMNILNKATVDDLEAVVGEKSAKIIDQCRSGKINIRAGGGGVYGKVSIL